MTLTNRIDGPRPTLRPRAPTNVFRVLDVVALGAGIIAFVLFTVGGSSFRFDPIGVSIRSYKNPAILFFALYLLLTVGWPQRRLLAQRLIERITRPLRPHMSLPMSILVLLAVAFTFHELLSGPVELRSDALGHYAYLRSIAIDRDLDFANEFSIYSFGSDLPSPDIKTPVGLVGNPWPVGLALLWLPLFSVAHLVVQVANATGTGWPDDGYSTPYVYAIVVGSELYGLIGIVLTARIVRRLVPQADPVAPVLLIVAATPLTFYLLHDPAMPHVPSLLTSALFTLYTLQTVGSLSPSRWLCVGLLAGACTLIRFQDCFLLLLPAILLTGAVYQQPRDWRSMLVASLGLFGGFVVALLPQLLVWRHLYGTWFLIPQGESFMRWTEPAVGQLLFSWRHGAFSWTPLLLVALIGLARWVSLNGWLGAAIFNAVVAEFYIAATALDWWAGASFGARRLISLSVFFAVGIATVIATRSPLLRRVMIGAGIVLTLWNYILITAFWNSWIPHSTAVNLAALVPDFIQSALDWSLQTFTWHGLTRTGAGKDVLLVVTGLLWILSLSRSHLTSGRIVADGPAGGR